MEKLAQEIFNILKGANLDVALFTGAGQKTIDVEEATRFYLLDEDLMISLRVDDNRTEVVVQAGQDFDVIANKRLLDSIKSSTHKYMGEFTVRRFNKNIQPKDFSHQSIAEAYSKAYGSLKTSYIQLPEARLIIKHTKGVNEEVRGARSRNIHSLFIENSTGERTQFPYRYMAGAKAMAKHVSEGGKFDDAKGTAILEMCKDVTELTQFVNHVRTHNLVNEGNSNVVEAVQEQIKDIKECIRSLQTSKGYNSFEAREVVEENSETGLDIANQFLYNTFETVDMNSVLSTVSRVVQEREGKQSMSKESLGKLYDLIKSGADLKINIDMNDPENPNNEDPVKYSGPEGGLAKLSAVLSFVAKSSKNDELFNILSNLSMEVHNMKRDQIALVVKVVNYLTKLGTSAPPAEPVKSESITESVITDLRRKIA